MDDERKRLERQRIAEQEGLEQPPPLSAVPSVNHDEASENTAGPEDTNGDSDNSPRAVKKVPTGPMPEIERGLCVVCQDEEATLAAVDCGYVIYHREHPIGADVYLQYSHLCMCPRRSTLTTIG